MKPIDHLGEISSFDSNSISGISINAIKSLLEYKNMPSDVMKKDINSGSQLQFYRTNDYCEISSTKALKESQYDNLNVSANAVVTKKPTEQDDMVVKAFYTSKYMDSPIMPCDGETTDGKSETSNNDGTKKESNKGGEVVSLKCQNEVAGRPNNSNGSSGSGGDDEDNRKPHVLKSNCERDDQAAEDDKKDEVEDEEIVAIAGESEDDGGSSDDADADVGIEDISIHGGDENVDAHNQVNNQVSSGQIPSLTCTVSEWSGPPPCCARDTSTVSPESVKKLKRPDLKIDIAQAKAMQALTCQPYSSYKDDEVNFEALVHVEEAFACRHNMRAWEECNDEHCQALQRSLRHTQNCHMRVLGGCVQCIRAKDALQSHASTCKELPGKCVVKKCDDIRDYMKKNALPDNRNWKYEHDKLFFEPSPPRTPTVTWPGNLCLLPFASESASFESDTDKNSSASATTLQNQYHVVREPDFGSDLFSGVNLMQQQHVQNDEQPSNCSARSSIASLQPSRVEGEDELPASPLSASNMPGVSQASGGVSIKQEVLWPLNRAQLSVGDDGSYLEDVHWQQKVYIGGGSCGRCYQCVDLKTQKLFAIKCLREDDFEMTGLEIWGTMSGKHDNILELFGAVKSCGKITIFMEYMSGGSIDEAGQQHEGLALHIFSKILSAVEFMHSLGFVHRDIKGANILIDSTGQKVKLADFDTSIKLDNGYQQDNNPRGTQAFMAPEVCRSESHSFSADIWSSTCVLYQMLTGTAPWEQYRDCDPGALFYQIGVAPDPPHPPACSPEVEDLFSLGFRLKPEERSTATELLNHRSFKSSPHLSNMQLSRSSSTYDCDYESNLCSAFDLELSSADDDEVSENETRRSGTSSSDAYRDYDDDADDDEDADDDDDDYGDDVIGVGDGASGSANAAALDVSSTEGEWQGRAGSNSPANFTF